MITLEKLKELLHYDPDTGRFTWKVNRAGFAYVGEIAGSYGPKGYYQLKILAKSYRAHRVAFFYMTGRWPIMVDHINRIRDDNRWINLREVTAYENNQNVAQRRTTSVVPGIRIYNDKYLTVLHRGKYSIYIGLFKNFDDAKFALDNAEMKLFKTPDYSIASSYVLGMM